jgi:GNAT superfamily N-acetyltransferase
MSIPAKTEDSVPASFYFSPDCINSGTNTTPSLVRTDHFEPCLMTVNQIDTIMELEKATWIPALQASRTTILNRLEGGHRILALRQNSSLAGMAGWRYSSFSVDDSPAVFPLSFLDFSSRRSVDLASANSAFIYNVGVKPADRKQGLGSLLLQHVFERIIQDGVSQVFLDSRMPSYQGSFLTGNELIRPDPQFKESVDRYFVLKKIPLKRELMLDQTVRFYLKNGFEPWFLRKNFIHDESSGNIRLICRKAL